VQHPIIIYINYGGQQKYRTPQRRSTGCTRSCSAPDFTPGDYCAFSRGGDAVGRKLVFQISRCHLLFHDFDKQYASGRHNSQSRRKIDRLYVRDKQTVKKGDCLAVIENPASVEDLSLLKKSLEKLLRHPDDIDSFPVREMNAGEVQPAYSAFYRSLVNYKRFRELSYYPKKTTAVETRLEQYKKYYGSNARQKTIAEAQFQLAEKQFGRDSLLNEKGVISKEDMDIARKEYLQNLSSLENADAALYNIDIQIAQTRELLLDTRQQYFETKSNLESELYADAVQLLNEINTWEMTYVLTSPLDGTVAFTDYWAENQNVTAGEVVFTVIPTEDSGFLGKALLPVERSGKVKPGLKVNIRFANYPDREFGMVRGIVNKISLIPSNGYYPVEIGLPEGLTTTYHKQLPFSQEMQAQAEIVTDDLRLIERVLMPVKKIIADNR